MALDAGQLGGLAVPESNPMQGNGMNQDNTQITIGKMQADIETLKTGFQGLETQMGGLTTAVNELTAGLKESQEPAEEMPMEEPPVEDAPPMEEAPAEEPPAEEKPKGSMSHEGKEDKEPKEPKGASGLQALDPATLPPELLKHIQMLEAGYKEMANQVNVLQGERTNRDFADWESKRDATARKIADYEIRNGAFKKEQEQERTDYWFNQAYEDDTPKDIDIILEHMEAQAKPAEEEPEVPAAPPMAASGNYIPTPPPPATNFQALEDKLLNSRGGL